NNEDRELRQPFGQPRLEPAEGRELLDDLAHLGRMHVAAERPAERDVLAARSRAQRLEQGALRRIELGLGEGWQAIGRLFGWHERSIECERTGRTLSFA